MDSEYKFPRLIARIIGVFGGVIGAFGLVGFIISIASGDHEIRGISLLVFIASLPIVLISSIALAIFDIADDTRSQRELYELADRRLRAQQKASATPNA